MIASCCSWWMPESCIGPRSGTSPAVNLPMHHVCSVPLQSVRPATRYTLNLPDQLDTQHGASAHARYQLAGQLQDCKNLEQAACKARQQHQSLMTRLRAMNTTPCERLTAALCGRGAQQRLRHAQRSQGMAPPEHSLAGTLAAAHHPAAPQHCCSALRC